MATIKDVARLANTSTATVSRYLNGERVREKNRLSIESAIERLQYSIHPIARGLKTNRSYMIGMIVPYLGDTFFSIIAENVQKFLLPHRYSLVVLSIGYNTDNLPDAVRFLIDKSVDGVLISMLGGIHAGHLASLKEKRIPVVLLDGRLPDGDETAVMADNVHGAYAALAHLIENGHRDIAIINGEQKALSGKERFKGYLRALEDYGIEADPDLIKFGDYLKESGYLLMRELLLQPKRPTAVLVCNDSMTVGALQAINELKVRIFDELSYITFDDSEITRIFNPQLTSVRQPLEQISQSAGKALLDIIEKGEFRTQTIRLKTELIVRDSVRNIRS